MDTLFEGEALNLFAVLDKSRLEAGPRTVTIRLLNTLTQQECVHSVDLRPDMITADEDTLFKMAAKQMIQRAERNHEDKAKVIDISVKY